MPAPDVIVPPLIDQEYVVPTGPAGAEAALPVEFGRTIAGAVIVGVPSAVTFTVCEVLAEQPFTSVTVTL